MLTAKELLDKEFLEARCMLVELAAVMDRYERAEIAEVAEAKGLAEPTGEPLDDADERLQRIYQALDILASPQATPNRSEQLLNLFSDL